jgi:hypothetical protein
MNALINFIKYSDGYEIATEFGFVLTTLGIGVESPFGICSHGCCVWVHAITPFRLFGFSISELPEGFRIDSTDFQINHSRMTAILMEEECFRGECLVVVEGREGVRVGWGSWERTVNSKGRLGSRVMGY